MTYRERRERKVENYRRWGEKRVRDADAVIEAGRPYTSDIAFNTQPGHIPFRAKLIAREDRAMASAAKGRDMQRRADGIEGQLATSIYDDDPDAIAELRKRIERLEAERERIKAYNKSVRAGAPDTSLLDEKQRGDLATHLRFSGQYVERKGPVFPSYGLSNLSGNIKRQRDRLARLEREAAARKGDPASG